MKNQKLHFQDISKDFLLEFEKGLRIFGFKRIEANIYGFLVLCNESKSAEEIAESLALSQSAVSQGLHQLAQWGAIETHYDSIRRVQVHKAPEDSFKVIASIFKKREQEAISILRNVSAQTVQHLFKQGDGSSDSRIQRLQSIVLACDAAQAVMSFVLSLGTLGNHDNIAKVVRNLPRVFDFVITGTSTAREVALRIKDMFIPSEKK